MTLIKDHQVCENIWRDVSEAGPVEADGPIIVSVDQWRAHRDLLDQRNAPLGLRLRPDQPPAIVADDLARFALVALEFPSLTDGRAFSHARLLRERHGFQGEIRAVGEVLQDQMFFMRRCGFDSYELAQGRDAAGAIGALTDFSVAYQPATDGASSIELRDQR